MLTLAAYSHGTEEGDRRIDRELPHPGSAQSNCDRAIECVALNRDMPLHLSYLRRGKMGGEINASSCCERQRHPETAFAEPRAAGTNSGNRYARFPVIR